MSNGPLTDLKVIELKGIGPAPYAGMLLADMGADVLVIERPGCDSGITQELEKDLNGRGKSAIVLDLKDAAQRDKLLQLIAEADVLIEGYRPGVAERLGIGPAECHVINPRLIYGRITGWGQTGPLAQQAGHDINYIALSGVLAAIGQTQQPLPPLNLVGDFAGGSMFLLAGILAALLEREKSDLGQVIDAAMSEGASSLMTFFHTMNQLGRWQSERQANLLDGAAHFYRTYRTQDHKFISIGAIEDKFYRRLIDLLELDWQLFSAQHDKQRWPHLTAIMAQKFLSQPCAYWCDLLEDANVCFAPVLDIHDAPTHPQHQQRESFISVNGVVQPAPAPRFSRTPSSVCHAPQAVDNDIAAHLARWQNNHY